MMGALVSVASATVEERVARIRQWYSTVEALEPVSRTVIKFDQDSDPLSGELTIRHFPDGFASVTVSYSAGDHDGATDHYYYRHGEVFFVFSVNEWWRFSEGSSDSAPKTEDTRVERRFYYDDASCIRQLERSATAGQGTKLAAILSEMDQTPVKPDGLSVEHFDRAKGLLNAEKPADVIKLYAAGEPGC